MPATKERFVDDLVRACPEARPRVEEHLQEFEGELLLHLVVADVLRLAIAMFDARETEPLGRCLAAVTAGLTDGDEYVQNAIAVSFVEDTPYWDEEMFPFIAGWPEPLQAEPQDFEQPTAGAPRTHRPGQPATRVSTCAS